MFIPGRRAPGICAACSLLGVGSALWNRTGIGVSLAVLVVGVVVYPFGSAELSARLQQVPSRPPRTEDR